MNPRLEMLCSPTIVMQEIRQTLIPLTCLAVLGFALSSFILNIDMPKNPPQTACGDGCINTPMVLS